MSVLRSRGNLLYQSDSQLADAQPWPLTLPQAGHLPLWGLLR